MSEEKNMVLNWESVITGIVSLIVIGVFHVINIFYSEPISDTFGPFVTVLFYLTVGRHMLKKLGEPASV